MKIIEQYSELDSTVKRGVALGSFDGIHIGHEKLIKVLTEKCNDMSLESCVYTFNNHPLSIIRSYNSPLQITNLEMKQRILNSLKIDVLYLQKFDEEFMALSPEDFIKKILVEKLNCKVIVVGFDYTFGYKAQGNVALLKKLSSVYDFQVCEIPPVTIEGVKVGSTVIREYIKTGNIEDAMKFLGRPYSIASKVIHGKSIGKTMGYPTANILVESSHLLLKEGVYATQVIINGNTYKGATSVGTNPTINNNNKISIETFIIDFDDTIYGNYIEIQFIKRLRDQIKFKNTTELTNQLQEDVYNAKKYLQL